MISSTPLEASFVDRFMTSSLMLLSLVSNGNVLVDVVKVNSLLEIVDNVFGVRILEDDA